MIDDKVMWMSDCHYNDYKSFDMNINNPTPTPPPTYVPTYLPTHQPIYQPTYLLTHLLTTYPPIHHLPTYLHTTQLLTHHFTHPPTYFVNLPIYLPTFYFLFSITYPFPTYHPTTCYLLHSLVVI